MALIGYARVSTGEQTVDPQLIELRAAGCARIETEFASGGNASRPVLGRLVSQIKSGDTLVVVRLDRLARSLSHLLQVIESLAARGAHFRSLNDPVDSSSPQGKFTLQVLGAAAELERALIRDRTMAGLAAARANGRVGGNPGLRAKDEGVIRRMGRARKEAWLDRAQDRMDEWLGLVTRNRPEMPWDELVKLVNLNRPTAAAEWSVKTLMRHVKAMVDQGLVSKGVLSRAPRQPDNIHTMQIIKAIKEQNNNISLNELCKQLEKLHIRTPRGGAKWSKSSVKNLIDRF